MADAGLLPASARRVGAHGRFIPVCAESIAGRRWRVVEAVEGALEADEPLALVDLTVLDLARTGSQRWTSSDRTA